MHTCFWEVIFIVLSQPFFKLMNDMWVLSVSKFHYSMNKKSYLIHIYTQTCIPDVLVYLFETLQVVNQFDLN